MDHNLDNIIDYLLKVSNQNNLPPFNEFFTQQLICNLCKKVREVFMDQEMMLRLQAPINVCGDIHGQFEDLLEIFSLMGIPGKQHYLFLGDYVDRGRQSLECICLLFALKIRNPNEIFLLRGNHEEAEMNTLYGFYDECKRRYSIKLWKTFIDVFNCMPVAAVISGKIFCCHGGLSPSLRNFQQIQNLKRPCMVPDEGLMCDLLWSDPRTDQPDVLGWECNVDRGVSFTFGKDVVHQFLNDFDLDMICRAHEVVQDGYEFFAKKGLVTVFSAPLYTDQFDNDGAVLNIDSNLRCQFYILKPQRNSV